MATGRPRTAGLGALRRQSLRAYNEPFTPNVVEKDENEAHILRLELPDFNEQHVKVKVEEGARTVVVTGDRLLATNRLLILNKTYPIPQDCSIDKVHHKLEAGFLIITMPKQTAPPAAPKDPEQKTPEKGSEETTPENATPPQKEPEQKTPEKGSEETSPGNASPPPKGPKQTSLEKGGEETSPGNATPPPKEPEQTTRKKESEEISPEEDKGKSAELQKKGSVKAGEEAPTPAPTEVPPPAAAKNGPVRGESGKEKTTPDEKIKNPNQKPTEKENQNPEKGKESKTEKVGKNEKTGKIGTGTPSQKATTGKKYAAGFTNTRRVLPVTASVAAAVVTVAAAYLAFAYYGFSFAME
ncbi:proteoglycan 4 isoform X2 [Cucurbita moschata]|uniref:Proteoglycan 4 isoform X2 n=1 Tax=Cucurbita moschata TaxID=3662 RepID=A0A6J1G164_CUCMO|nr:proteoglycan 4 isoform X2 [Cucurbita moschata]